MKKLNQPDQNAKKDKLTTLYPFNGRSAYLFDKFYIIGYNYSTLNKILIKEPPKIIIERKDKDFKETRGGSFTIEETPSILNEIMNDYSKDSLDSKKILQMIFPHKLKCFYIWEGNNMEYNNEAKRAVTSSNLINNCNKDYNENDTDTNFTKIDFENNEIDNMKSYRVIFSSNPQSDKNSKKSLNGFANIFYRKFNETKDFGKRRCIYYVPYCFCIISEYPYFSSFDKLIKCIKRLYSQESIYIPIEVLIYNLINLSPSPFNSNIILDLSSSCSQESILGKLKEDIMESSNKKPHSKKNINRNLGLNFDQNLIKNFKLNILNDPFEVSSDTMSTRGLIHTMKKKNIIKNKNEIIMNKKQDNPETYKIEFQLLSGYPLIQYNLTRVLFNKLSVEKIITVFFFMFLEKDVIFFSKNIEYLTLSINAYLNLNFPLNDEKYYFIGCAISLKDFQQGRSEFGIKNYTSLIGINDSYTDDYRINNIKMNDHLVVDLDRGEIFIGEDLDERNKKVNENNKKLVRLIGKMCKEIIEDEKTMSITLNNSIKQLSKSLLYISAMMNNNLSREFFDFNDQISFSNRTIQ